MKEEREKVVLVTGASSGLGRVTAEELARRGHRVFAGMRGVEGKNRRAATEIEERAEADALSLHTVDIDVDDETSVDAAAELIVAQAGRIDVVVNNAGIAYVGLLEASTIEQVRRLFDTNVLGILRVNRAVLPHMRVRGSGLLVHVSSGLGRITFPARGVYSASKFALEALAETYRYELAASGVDSVIVEPGVYATGVQTKFGVSSHVPADPARVASYGEPGRKQTDISRGLDAAALADVPNDPLEFAGTLAELIATPFGERPLRTLAGKEVEALRGLNETAAAVQAGILEMFGLGELTALCS